MTSYKDNIFSGNIATTSANSSQSPVLLGRTHRWSAAGGTAAITQTGTFPPNTENLTAYLFVIQNGSATVSNKVTVSAGGTNLVVIDQFGSAVGQSGATLTSFARFAYVASACAQVPAPAASTNGGEIPYSLTFVPASADKTGQYQVRLTFNRVDTTWGPTGPYVAPSGV